jgi:hypothetical protein
MIACPTWEKSLERGLNRSPKPVAYLKSAHLRGILRANYLLLPILTLALSTYKKIQRLNQFRFS